MDRTFPPLGYTSSKCRHPASRPRLPSRRYCRRRYCCRRKGGGACRAFPSLDEVGTLDREQNPTRRRGLVRRGPASGQDDGAWVAPRMDPRVRYLDNTTHPRPSGQPARPILSYAILASRFRRPRSFPSACFRMSTLRADARPADALASARSAATARSPMAFVSPRKIDGWIGTSMYQ